MPDLPIGPDECHADEMPTLKWISTVIHEGPPGLTAQEAIDWVQDTSKPTIID